MVFSFYFYVHTIGYNIRKIAV